MADELIEPHVEPTAGPCIRGRLGEVPDQRAPHEVQPGWTTSAKTFPPGWVSPTEGEPVTRNASKSSAKQPVYDEEFAKRAREAMDKALEDRRKGKGN